MAEAGDSTPGREIALAEMIETLRRELEMAQIHGAARPVAFGVGKVELELKVAVSRTAKGEGGVKFWVVTAGGGAERGTEMVHTFKLTLSPLDAETDRGLPARPDHEWLRDECDSAACSSRRRLWRLAGAASDRRRRH